MKRQKFTPRNVKLKDPHKNPVPDVTPLKPKSLNVAFYLHSKASHLLVISQALFTSCFSELITSVTFGLNSTRYIPALSYRSPLGSHILSTTAPAASAPPILPRFSLCLYGSKAPSKPNKRITYKQSLFAIDQVTDLIYVQSSIKYPRTLRLQLQNKQKSSTYYYDFSQLQQLFQQFCT